MHLKIACNFLVIFLLFCCQQNNQVEVDLNKEDAFDWFLNYPLIELAQNHETNNYIAFLDTSIKIPYIYNHTDSIYFDLNKDGTILKTEYLRFSDYNIFGQKRLLIKLQPNISNRSSISLIKFFNSEKIYQAVSDIYTGYFKTEDDSVMVGIFLSPNYYNFNKNPGLFITINNNNDSVFDSDEIFSLQYVFQIKNKFFELNELRYQNGNITAVFTEPERRIGINIGLNHPHFEFSNLEDSVVHSLDEFIGQVTVINWWFTTCAPCIKKIPSLNKLIAEYPNVNFIAVDPIDTASDIKLFLSNNDFNFNHYITDQQTAILNGVKGMPHVVIVDEKQKIIYSGNGSINNIKKTLEKYTK